MAFSTVDFGLDFSQADTGDTLSDLDQDFSASFLNTSSLVVMEGGLLGQSGGVGDLALYYHPAPTSADSHVQAIISFRSLSDSGLLLGIRYNPDTVSGYHVRWSSGDWMLCRNDGGGETVLASYSETPPILADRLVRIAAEGSTLQVYINNVLRITVTDSTYASGSYFVGTGGGVSNLNTGQMLRTLRGGVWEAPTAVADAFRLSEDFTTTTDEEWAPDGFRLSDAVTVADYDKVTVTDAFRLTAPVSGVRTSRSSVTEAGVWGDLVSGNTGTSSAVGELFRLTDASLTRTTERFAAVDILRLGSDITVTGHFRVSDGITVGDAHEATGVYRDALSDGWGLSEETTARSDYALSVADGMRMGDQTASDGEALIILRNRLRLSEELSEVAKAEADLVGSWRLGDATSVRIDVSAAERLGLRETLTGQSHTHDSLLERLILNDALSAEVRSELEAAASDGWAVGDTAIPGAAAMATVGGAWSLSDWVAPGAGVLLSDTLVLGMSGSTSVGTPFDTEGLLLGDITGTSALRGGTILAGFRLGDRAISSGGAEDASFDTWLLKDTIRGAARAEPVLTEGFHLGSRVDMQTHLDVRDRWRLTEELQTLARVSVRDGWSLEDTLVDPDSGAIFVDVSSSRVLRINVKARPLMKIGAEAHRVEVITANTGIP